MKATTVLFIGVPVLTLVTVICMRGVHDTAYGSGDSTPSDVLVSASGFVERPLRPAVFLTCRAAYVPESIPAGEDLLVRCVPIGGAR